MFWVFARIALGTVLLFSGIEKLLSPYQNFLYVIQAYALLPAWAEVIVAQTLPWSEALTGIFLVVGLGIPWSLRAASILFGLFIIVVGQALMRGLPLENCGCFGASFHVNPRYVVIVDSALLALLIFLLRQSARLKPWSLDAYCDAQVSRKA